MIRNGNSTLGKKVEGEFAEGTLGIRKLIETLIKSFLKSESNYGTITDIEETSSVMVLLRNYIQEEKLDIHALKFRDKILLSRTNLEFEDLYEVVKKYSTIYLKRRLVEVWDDKKNKILHLLIIPLRKHFPIEYSDQKEYEENIEIILEEIEVIKEKSENSQQS